MIRRTLIPLVWTGLLVLGCAGCMPSCRKVESRALFPADSLSRQRAQHTRTDTLRLVWTTDGNGEHRLEHPRTIQYTGARLLVGDTGRNTVFAFDSTGRWMSESPEDRFSFPYLAGSRADTAYVFNAGASRVDALLGDSVYRSFLLPSIGSPREALQYVGLAGPYVYYKVARDGQGSQLFRLDASGRVLNRFPLQGPQWRQAGLLRAWGDTLVSLTGFRPVVDLWYRGRTPDTLALAGFDSPMLARSRLFVRGEVDEPPLLVPSAATAGNYLFVLNIRPGWLRVDVYDRTGVLRRILSTPSPAYDPQFYPVDLAVRKVDDSAYVLSVVTVKPKPGIVSYRWQDVEP